MVSFLLHTDQNIIDQKTNIIDQKTNTTQQDFFIFCPLKRGFFILLFITLIAL